MRALIVVTGMLVLAGCSFTSASGLEECQTSNDCREDQVCTEGFCLPQPVGCGRRFGSLDAHAIPFGAVLPISAGTPLDEGVDESDTQSLHAVLLALEEVNQRGVGGRPFTLHMCDNGSDEELTRGQVAWLVNDKKVAAVLTAHSAQTLAAVAETVPKGVLTLSYSATSPELTAVPDRVDGSEGLLWRTAPSDAIQGRVISQLLLTDTRFSGVQRVGVLYVNDPYGQGLSHVISQGLAGKRDMQLLFYPRRGDVETPVNRLNEYNPDLTVVVGFNDDLSRIVRRAAQLPNLSRAAGHRWLFTDGIKDAAMLQDDLVREQVDGTYGTGPAQGAGAAFGSFRSRFQTRYGKDPSNFSFTSHAYDALYLMALGAAYAHGRDGEVTGTRMAEGMTKLSSGPGYQLTPNHFTNIAAELLAGRSVDVDGASGKLDFDDKGDAPAPVELWQVAGMGFRTDTIIEPGP